MGSFTSHTLLENNFVSMKRTVPTRVKFVSDQVDVCNHAVAFVAEYGLVVHKGGVTESDSTLSTGSKFMVIPTKRTVAAADQNTDKKLTSANTQCSLGPNHVDKGKFLYIVT